MSLTAITPSLLWMGEESPSGVYLLRFHVTQRLQLSLGRFRGGVPLAFAPGPYLYVGSALAHRGASALGRRLLRHAARSKGKAHPLRRHLLAAFPSLPAPDHKRPHWHIDHLLEAPTVVLTSALVIGTSQPLERGLAAWLMQRPIITAPVAGAGASDDPGQTHLLGVVAFSGWWRDLCRAIAYRFVGEL